VDERDWVTIGFVVWLLWMFAAFRWRVKSGMAAGGVLAVVVIAIDPSILDRIFD
jgi:hypothetical protein